MIYNLNLVKSERKKLVNKLDKVWGELIRAIGRCELCEGVGKLDSHHIEGRSPQVLRWDVGNGIALCFKCHRLGVHSPASSVQAEFREKITNLKGKEEMERLKQMRYDLKKYSLSDLRELLEYLKSHIEA